METFVNIHLKDAELARQFSGPKGWCIGCARTREECQDWKALKPFAQKALEKELKKRMSRIEVERTK